MNNMECPVSTQREHTADEAVVIISSDLKGIDIQDSATIKIQCNIATCAVQAILTDKSKISGKMMTFGVADSHLCVRNESPIEPDMKVVLPY